MPVPTISFDRDEDVRPSGLTAVKSVRELADSLGIRYSTLVFFANTGRSSNYVTFEVRKRSGAPRIIDAPVDVLKHIQKRIADQLSTIYHPPKPVHGFVVDRDILTNAAPHAGRRWVLNIDLKDFFPSIHFGRVRGVLTAAPYRIPSKVATVIARICCHQDRLPQGAPTSPVVANMVARSLDTKLRELARKHHISYTRYADDITFSGHSRSIPNSLAVFDAGTYRCGDGLRTIVSSAGFVINEDKFRVQFGGMRKIVTGLVVNDHPNVRRRFVREIRAMLHAWREHGYEKANSYYSRYHWKVRTTRQRGAPAFRRVLRGKLEYLRHIKGETDLVVGLFRQLAKLDTSPSLQTLVAAMDARRATLTDRLDRSVFVLESDEHMEQGTGFLVADLGIVTCAHVVRPDTCAFLAQDPETRYELRVIHRDEHRDIAILEFSSSLPSFVSYLTADPNAKLSLSTVVTLAGFANFAPGVSLSIKTAQISQRRRWFDHDRFNVNTGIISGMSGGPVLSSAGAVIGIAATGSSSANKVEDPEAQHGVIPWSEVVSSLASPKP